VTTRAYPEIRAAAANWQANIPGAVLSGIVGDAAHRGCYHIAREDQSATRYCCTPPNDSRGPSDAACAIDMNMPAAQMKIVTKRLINAIDRKDPRAEWIAEIYGTVNGSTVVGRLFGRYATSDTSHLWHVHLAIYRQYVRRVDAWKDILGVILGKPHVTRQPVQPKPVPRPAGPMINLVSVASGKYVCAEAGWTKPLIANRAAVGDWEQFVMTDVATTEVRRVVSLYSIANGLYVCAEAGGTKPLIANRAAVGTWEKFEVIRNGDDTVSFRSLASGKYVCAEAGGTKPLIANRGTIGQWEKFKMVT
jgi:hypothetical protein